MKCPRCETESRIRANDEFCHKCGYPLKIVAKDGESTDLKSFFLDVDSGIMLINGKEVNNVTAFSFKFDSGKYGLCITRDEPYKALVKYLISISIIPFVICLKHYTKES